MRVLVCGGRRYVNYTKLASILSQVLETYGSISMLIHGGATGADQLAGNWARKTGIPEQVCPVTRDDWKTYGKAAGVIRNQQMLDQFNPDIVVAFPGGRGTSDMINRSRGTDRIIIVVAKENGDMLED